MRTANLALKFALELCAFAALAYWGAVAGSGVGAVLLALAAPALAIGAWARLAAPRSEHRLPLWPRVAFELGVFALAAVALLAAGATTAGLLFAAVAAVNAVGLFAFDQLEA